VCIQYVKILCCDIILNAVDFILQNQIMWNQLQYGAVVLCCVLVIVWIYIFHGPTASNSVNVDIISNTTSHATDVNTTEPIEKYLDVLLE
jgi:hypothetical protein